MRDSSPSRRPSDHPTSSGDLIGRSARTDHLTSSNTGRQNGMSRHMRGSFMTANPAPPNSPAKAAFARARKASASKASILSRSNLRQSFQSLPPAARMASFRSLMTRRFAISFLIVDVRRHQMLRRGAAKANERSGGARCPAAMHAQHNHYGRVQTFGVEGWITDANEQAHDSLHGPKRHSLPRKLRLSAVVSVS